MNLTQLFEDLDISQELRRAVTDMGFEEATPVQGQSIGPIMAGKDLVAQAPTGTGKTCAFGIPAVEGTDESSRYVETLILCPTRELVIQTSNELLKLTKYKKSVRIVPVYGGQSIERQINALKRSPQIVVATPGRLMDHMRRHTIKLDRLEFLILDEADEMLNMGFREDIDFILQSAPEDRQTVLFSATLSPEILQIAKTYLQDPVKVRITKSELTVPSIKQYYLEVRREYKTDVLARLIDINDFKLSMVFCNTKRMVDELAHEMAARGYSVESLHGDMKQQQRDRVVSKFKKGDVEILIATDVAARGLDIDDVEAVFNYDLPIDLEYYVHRIGRTGRANRSGVSYSFVGGREMRHLKEIMDYTKAKIQFMKVPEIADIMDVRSVKSMNEVLQIIKRGNQSAYEGYIEKFLLENPEYTIMDVASAFLSQQVRAEELEKQMRELNQKSGRSKNRDKNRDRDRDRDREWGKNYDRNHRNDAEAYAEKNRGVVKKVFDKKKNKKKSVRVFVNQGKMDNLKKKQLLDLLERHANIENDKIMGINIMDKFTFMDVETNSVEQVIDFLNGTKYKGRQIRAELAN